jgi:hypothetical protein
MAKKAHGNTRKAADKDLAEGVITEQSHISVIAGEMSLQEARNIGVDDTSTDTGRATEVQDGGTTVPGRASADAAQGVPAQPVTRISKDDATQECWCGCGQWTKPNRRWLPGHDQRGKGIIKRAVKEGKVEELSPQLKDYGTERGLI